MGFLWVSTMIHPEVVTYSDSGKVAAMAGSAPGGKQADRRFFSIFKADSAVDYYDGE